MSFDIGSVTDRQLVLGTRAEGVKGTLLTVTKEYADIIRNLWNDPRAKQSVGDGFVDLASTADTEES